MSNLRGDIGAERAILSGLCQYGKDVLIDIDELIETNTFSQKSNQIIFRCIYEALQTNDKLDIPCLFSAASSLGLYDFINKPDELEYIHSLFNMSVKIENVRTFAVLIKKLDIAKKLQGVVKESYSSLDEVTGRESISEIFSLVENPIFEFTNSLDIGEESPQNLADDAEDILKEVFDNPVDVIGIPTGFSIYDGAIGGAPRRGSVNLIGARPKVGKSSLGKQIAINIMENMNIPILEIDTEMNKHDMLFRSLACMSDVDINNIETGKATEEEKSRIYNSLAQLKNGHIIYKKVAGKSFDEILSIIRRWIIKDVGVDENGNTKDCMLIYDYFKLMSDGVLNNNMAEYQALGFQISALTDFCNIYQVPCIAFVQLNRDGITKETTDIISQSDRLLWLCGSFSIFKRKTPEEIAEDGANNGNMKLIVAETRYGAGMHDNNYINVNFTKNTGKLVEVNSRHQVYKTKMDGEISFGIQENDIIDEEVPFD